MTMLFPGLAQQAAFLPTDASPALRVALMVLAISVGAYALLTVYPLVAGPIALRRNHRASAVPGRMIAVAGGELLPPEIRRFIENSRRGLEKLGFTPLALLKSASTPGVVMLAVDAAGVVATSLAVPGGNGTVVDLVGFTTQLSSGTRVRTSNAPTESPWPPRPGDDVIRFAEGDLARLHALHQARVARYVARGMRIAPIAVTDPVGYQFAEERESLERAVSSGYFVRDGSQMRPTWKGACLNAWRYLSPLKDMRESRVERTRQALMQQIGMRA